jgi:hypothetical protein
MKKLKSITDFQKETFDLEKMENILGGSGKPVGNIYHTQQEKNTTADGSCCHMRTDWWADTDGNGVQGVNEICQQDTQWKWICD